MSEDQLFPEAEEDNLNPIFPGTTVLSRFKTPEQIKRTSMLASLAMVKQGRVNLEDLELSSVQNSMRIENGEEDDVRQEIDEARKSHLKAGVLNEISESGYDIELADNHSALEEEGVDQIVNMSFNDATQAQVHAAFPELMDQNRDYRAKMAILQSKADGFRAEHEANPAILNFIDYAATILPLNLLNKAMMAIGALDEEAPFYDVGARKQEGRKRLLDLPLEDFKIHVEKMVESMRDPAGELAMNNPVINEMIINEFITGTNRLEENVFAAIDVATLIPLPTSAAVKAAENPLRFMRPLNREMSSSTAVGRILTEGADITPVITNTHAIDVLLPSHAATTNELAVGVSGDVIRKLNVRQDMLRELIETNPLNVRLTDEAAEQALEDTFKRLEAQFKPGQIMDTRVLGHDPLTGLQEIEVYIGKANGTGGFGSEAGAKKSADLRGFLNFKTMQDDSGQWFISQRHTVAEEGFVPLFDPEEVKRAGLFAASTPFDHWGPKQLASIQNATASQQLRWNKVINKKMLPLINKLKGSSKRQLEEILEVSHANEKWFNHEELLQTFDAQHGRYPTVKETDAYFAYKELNDFDWVVRNNKLYTDLSRQGYGKVHIDKLNYTGNGKFLSKVESPEGMRLFDVSSDITYDANNPLTKEQLNSLIDSQDYQVYRLNTRDTLPTVGDEHVDVVIGRRSDFAVGPLEWNQLPYKPGGHRIYPRNSLFVKQGRVYTREDGTQYMLDPLTHTITPSKREAEAWAKNMENLRLAVDDFRKGDISNEALEEAFEATAIKDLDQWERMVRNGEMVEDTPFEVVFDGELPKSMTEATRGGAYSMQSDIPLDDNTRFLINRNRKFTGFRGDHLQGPDGELATILSPFESLNEAVSNANKTGVYYNYRTAATESWAKTFEGIIEKKVGDTPNQIFFNPKFIDTAEPALVAKAEAVRSNIIRQLNFRTKDRQKAEHIKRKVAGWVEDKTGIKYQIAKNITDKNVLGTYREWARNIYMGFANPGQFLLQTQTAVAAVTANPLLGAQAWRSAPSMRWVLYGEESALKAIAKKTAITGMDEGNFVNMVKMAQKSGFLDVGDEAFIFAKAAPIKIGATKLKGAAATAADWTKRTGSFVVNDVGNSILREAERINRITAWQIAYRGAMREAKGEVLKDSDVLLKRLVDESNTWSFNMNSAGKTALQQGIPGLVGQFLQYGVNYGDAVFGTASKLTRAQRLRMIAGTTLLYGGAALPEGRMATDFLVDQYQKLTGEEVNDVAYRGLTSGAFDAIIYYLTDGELDPSFGTRAGYDGFVQMIKQAVTEKSMLELASGPGFNANYGLGTAIWDNLKYLSTSFREGSITPEDMGQMFLDMARVVKTGSDLDKALILRKGMLATKGGMKLSEGNTLEGVAALMGIPLRQEVDAWRMYEDERDEKQYVNSLAKKMAENNTRAMLANSMEEAAYFSKVNNFLFQGESATIQNRLINEVMRRTPNDFYWEMAQRRLLTQPESAIANAPIQRERRRLKARGEQ